MADNKKFVTVQLDYPIEHEGHEVASLTFRRMRAGDALIAEEEVNKARAGYRLYAALANVSLDVIEKLDLDDLERVAEEVIPLMGKSVAEATRKARETAGDEASSGAT